jgi:hypothetical protein
MKIYERIPDNRINYDLIIDNLLLSTVLTFAS